MDVKSEKIEIKDEPLDDCEEEAVDDCEETVYCEPLVQDFSQQEREVRPLFIIWYYSLIRTKCFA